MLDPYKMNLVLEAMSKAGWIEKAHLVSHGDHNATVTIKPTPAGGERFRAILYLMRELQPVLGNFRPDEMGWVCEYATNFAPNKDALSWWPSTLPPAESGSELQAGGRR